MAIELAVTLPDGQEYEYFRADLLTILRAEAGDATALTVIAQYQLYKDAAAFGAGATAGASIRITATFDASALGGASNALETDIDVAVIAGAQALTVQGVAFNTSTGTQVS